MPWRFVVQVRKRTDWAAALLRWPKGCCKYETWLVVNGQLCILIRRDTVLKHWAWFDLKIPCVLTKSYIDTCRWSYARDPAPATMGRSTLIPGMCRLPASYCDSTSGAWYRTPRNCGSIKALLTTNKHTKRAHWPSISLVWWSPYGGLVKSSSWWVVQGGAGFLTFPFHPMPSARRRIPKQSQRAPKKLAEGPKYCGWKNSCNSYTAWCRFRNHPRSGAKSFLEAWLLNGVPRYTSIPATHVDAWTRHVEKGWPYKKSHLRRASIVLGYLHTNITQVSLE